MNNPSWKAKKVSALPPVSSPCPQCGVGVLVRIDDNYISCTDCGFDIPIKEADDGEVQGT